MASRTGYLNFREIWRCARRVALAVALAAGIMAAFGLPASAAEPDGRERGIERYDDGGPPAGSEPRDLDQPYEDGTDEPPAAARPDTGDGEQVPGCRFRNGPLELVV